ncbi:MAG: RNA polymerase sigma-70 factor [Mangrovibacterium sp.]
MPKNTITSTEFGRLFQEYKAQFIAVARSYVRDSMVAEDLVVNSFVSFWENRAEIDTSNPPAYILVSIKRRCLNWLRDEKTHQAAHDDIQSSVLRLMTSRMETIESNNPSELYLTEMASIIEQELNKMPAQTREVFIASRFDAKTYKEICDKYDLTFNQVSFEIRKATQTLRHALIDYLPILIVLNIYHELLGSEVDIHAY